MRRLETSPDGAGSSRFCRRELRLPIRILALCRAVEKLNCHLVLRSQGRARRHFLCAFGQGRSFATPILPIILTKSCSFTERGYRRDGSLVASQRRGPLGRAGRRSITGGDRWRSHEQGWPAQAEMGRTHARATRCPQPITNPSGGADPGYQPTRSAWGGPSVRREAGAERLAIFRSAWRKIHDIDRHDRSTG